MQVLVMGATGTLGRQIARRALDAGHQVRCMVRSPRKAAFLQEWGCELTRGNLLEEDSLAYALEGQEAVIDAATARPTDSESVYRIDWDGKLNLLNHCRRAGLERFVFISLLEAESFRDVPLMDIKYCTEQLLAESGLAYTRVIRVSPLLIRAMQGVASFFEPGVNIAERLAFAEVTGGGVSLTSAMEQSYTSFGLDPAETTGLEAYLQEYFTSILRRLREMEADLDKDAKKKLPF